MMKRNVDVVSKLLRHQSTLREQAGSKQSPVINELYRKQLSALDQVSPQRSAIIR